MGLSRRTNQRGAEILADTFKVCRLIHATGNTSYHPLNQFKNHIGQYICHTQVLYLGLFFLFLKRYKLLKRFEHPVK